MTSSDDDLGERLSYAIQRAADAEARVKRMGLPYSEGGLDSIALEAAQKIEDLFAQHHTGGRTQRLAKVQVVIREAMRANLTGAAHWRASSDLQNIKEPR